MRNCMARWILVLFVPFCIAPVVVFGQTVESALEQQLISSGVDAKDAGKILNGVETKTGISFNAPLYDRVDFASFPDARINARKLTAPAVLVLTPQLINYVFKGKPDTFQGALRTYEFHLGKGVEKACTMMFPQVFEQIRGLSSPRGIASHEVVLVPRLDEFRFRFGGMWTPVMSVTLQMSVGVFAGGQQIQEKSYRVENMKETTHTLFPNSSQEYRAISKAMITALKQAAEELAANPVLIAYEKQEESEAAGQPKALEKPLEKIDMDAVYFLADTWKNYHENKHRLSLEERRIAVRILRIKDAWDKKDVSLQQDEINALIQEAKGLEPVSRKAMLEEARFHKKWTDQEVMKSNAFEDKIFNFAGDYTETVLDYAGVGVTVSKLVVLGTGCAASAGTACPMLAGVMGSFEMADVAAEGLGAASEEYFWKSGKAGTALYEGAKASLIEWGAGKLGGKLAEGTMGKAALKASQKEAVNAAGDAVRKGVDYDEAFRMADRVFVDSMESFRMPTKALDEFLKASAKKAPSEAEKLFTGEKAAKKSLKSTPQTAEIKKMPDFTSLNVL